MPHQGTPSHSRSVLEDRWAERTRRHQEEGAPKWRESEGLGQHRKHLGPSLAEAWVPVGKWEAGLQSWLNAPLWSTKESPRLLPGMGRLDPCSALGRFRPEGSGALGERQPHPCPVAFLPHLRIMALKDLQDQLCLLQSAPESPTTGPYALWTPLFSLLAVPRGRPLGTTPLWTTPLTSKSRTLTNPIPLGSHVAVASASCPALTLPLSSGFSLVQFASATRSAGSTLQERHVGRTNDFIEPPAPKPLS